MNVVSLALQLLQLTKSKHPSAFSVMSFFLIII